MSDINENADNNMNDTLNDSKNDNKKKRTIKLIIIFLIVFAVLFCGVYFGIGLYNAYLMQKPVEINTTASTTAAKAEDDRIKNPIDFASLKAMNEDIYAYIKIEDTNIDYPIVQSAADDSFYLKHKAEDKSWSASGAIYTESVNSKNFNDKITVIYGHNGYGDNFFTPLHKFEKEEFFNNHPYFYIYTQDKKLTYQVISAFKYDDRHIMNSFNFANTQELEEFQDNILNPTSALKNVRTELDTAVDINSKIVVLSTCINNQKSSRYLVCGVLVKNEQTY